MGYTIDNLKLIEEEFLNYEGKTPEKILLGYVKTPENDPHLKSLIDALSQKPTITEKLNYWLEIKDNFKDFYPKVTRRLSIPESIYNLHFKYFEDDIEFTNWLLRYEAEFWFDSLKRVKNLDKVENSPLEKFYIEAELKEIYEFEEKAKENLKAKKFDIYEYHYYSKYQDEIEYLRIINKYYEKKGQTNSLTIGDAQSNSKQVIAYAKYILLKNYLIKRLDEINLEEAKENEIEIIIPVTNTIKELEQPAAPEKLSIDRFEKEESRTKDFIKKTINSMHQEGYDYAFRNENDYSIFINLLTNYFEDKPFELPTTKINLKKNTKTLFAKTLNSIHNECSNKVLRSDKHFFEIIRIINHFEKLADNEIYNAITK